MPDITSPAHRKEERVSAEILRVTRKSTFTGNVHTLDLPITAQEWDRYTANPHQLIQNVLPRLSNSEREFLLSGTTQAEWDKAFPPEEEEDA